MIKPRKKSDLDYINKSELNFFKRIIIVPHKEFNEALELFEAEVRTGPTDGDLAYYSTLFPEFVIKSIKDANTS